MNGQMEQEKQIEEMAIVIANYDDSIICELGDCKGCSYNNFGRKCIWLSQAEALYNAGYRKESDIVAEVFEELERECSKVKGYSYSYGNLRVLIETIKEKHKGK